MHVIEIFDDDRGTDGVLFFWGPKVFCFDIKIDEWVNFEVYGLFGADNPRIWINLLLIKTHAINLHLISDVYNVARKMSEFKDTLYPLNFVQSQN